MKNSFQQKYILEKSLWTEDDFKTMGWHDNRIHAISFGENYELLFDIDYIFDWILKGNYYKFQVSPCTLIFENVYDIKFDLDSSGSELEIVDIFYENPRRPNNADYTKREIEFDWIIETQQGNISFTAVGYKQYVRQLPKFLSSQTIELNERGGVSFERIAIETQ